MWIKNKLILACVGLFVVCAGLSIATYSWARNYALNLNVNMRPALVFPTAAVAQQTVIPGADAIAQVNLPQPWNGKDRITILVMGIDQRQGETERGYRTDTMILMTLDPVTMRAGMLSIPRDLWVPISILRENGRINTANYWGDYEDYPGGGPALAKKTVEQVLGIQIQHYVRLNFTAFEDLIDRIGGIEVDVPDDIYDPKYPNGSYGIEPFSISKGKQTLDGPNALKYARTRATKGGDFDRSQRQQQVILAVLTKLKNPRIAIGLFAQAPDVLQEINASVKTDLSIQQIQQLGALALKIEPQNIKTTAINQDQVEFVTTPDGQEVIVPIRTEMAKLRDQFFALK
jgi:LCP family protein required for cell wall assembly